MRMYLFTEFMYLFTEFTYSINKLQLITVIVSDPFSKLEGRNTGY